MTGYEIQQGSASYPLVFLLVLSSDHITGATGLTPTVTLSKNGAAFAAPAGAVSEIGSGWYKVAGNATDTATLGPLLLHASVATADPTDVCYPVVAVNPQSSAYGLSLAKGTNLTGLNDIAAGSVWDVVNTAALHNVANSTGKQLRSIGVGTTDVIRTATLPGQGGQTSTTVLLDAGASATNQAYQFDVISIISGTDAGDSRVITGYVGATKVATVQRAWTVQPDNTSVFEITPTASVQVASYLTGQDPATLVLDVAQSLHNTAGTIGADIGLAAAGSGTSGPTAAQIATAVWTDVTAGDFATAGSIGLQLKTNVDAAISTRSTYAGGPVASVTAPITVNLAQSLSAARALDAIADTSLSLNDALHCAVAAAAGKEQVTGTAYLVQTPSTGTTIRTFTLDNATAPTSRT